MEPPSIKGHTIEAVIGQGSAGIVYEARRDDGIRVAIKVFESMSSNCALIRSRMSRVMDGGNQNVTVPIIAEALDIRPGCVVMPLMAAVSDSEPQRFLPMTLQVHLATYMGTDDAWGFVTKLAARIAALHTVRVAHGNLKPGNIFIDEEGLPLLADYASGLMPGVHHLDFSDALLYAPPEQLHEPDGYLEEDGYRWDTYAFGVLAYRLVTGKFPRCHSVFSAVCPAVGDRQKADIEADYEGIATGLYEDGAYVWPDEPADSREEKRREMIDFCLMLDPDGRPADMREVARRFDTIDQEIAEEEFKDDLISKRKAAERRRRLAGGMAKASAVVALALGGLWAWTEARRQIGLRRADQEFANHRSESEQLISGLEENLRKAKDSEKLALGEAEALARGLASEQEKSRAELASAQLTNDHLFQWILEEGVTGYPVLEKRSGRLALLAQEISKQLEGLEERPGLEKEADLLRIRRAEVILASGDEKAGLQALEDAILSASSELDVKIEARARLRHLLLRIEDGKTDVGEAITIAEQTLLKAWPEDGPEKLRGEAALLLVKGRVAEREEDSKAALGHYRESLKRLIKLNDQFPETPALRMTLGRVYLESALAAEGGGSPEDAAALRAKAAESFVKLAEGTKEKIPEVEYQIASANAARAIAEWQKGNTFTAEILARQGVSQLTKIAPTMPGDFRVARDLAAQQGIIATALRDAGRTADATKLLTKAISGMEAGIGDFPRDYRAKYLLASLKWQLSGIVGQKGETAEEIRLGKEARDLLNLILDADAKVPQPRAVRKSLAYLSGDLGHSAELSGQRELGVSFLKDARVQWERLKKEGPYDEEVLEGLLWVNRRLIGLGEN